MNRVAETSEVIARLWRSPELPLMEYNSCRILEDWLAINGFDVERNLCSIPTAFRATYGSGGPVIGILAEYDALPGISNDAVPYRSSLSQAAGHGCMHSHIGGGNAGAAIAVKDYLAATGREGTVVVMGCPAEEILWGKVALLGRGGFEGIDVLLTCHVDYQNAAVSRPTLSCFNAEFSFRGSNNHAGAARSRNALDGVELSVATIERMRGHQFPDSSVEHVIRNGGLLPGITPDRASLWINVRNPSFERAQSAYEYVRTIIQRSADIAQVSVREGFIVGSRGYLPNETLARMLFDQLRDVGEVGYSTEELDVLSDLAEAETGSDEVACTSELRYVDHGVDHYSQDDGEVSWRIPLGRVNWEIPQQIPLHSWSTTALAGMPMSHRGALMASETLYRGAVQLLRDESLVAAAKQELVDRLAGHEVTTPLYGSFDTLTTQPGRLWDGTWLDD